MMNESRFQRLLDRYGSDLRAWPPQVRAAAADLLARSAEAQERHECAQRLDNALRTALQLEAAPPSLRRRVQAVPDRFAGVGDRARPRRRARAAWLLWAPGAAVAALLLGVAVGATGALETPTRAGLSLEVLVYGPGGGSNAGFGLDRL
jgi:hypothetical protein